ncbi:putative beta-1,3-galactosyltransferase [Helicobacter fennelliae]|nr:putative beta-1,3-galactosyltransferase [Helicobacter fennelliae]
MHAPLISIVIPTFNVESYIARCLESCINQTLHDIEILIIDDCGSDDSIAIARDYAKKDSRIKIIHNPRNLGLFRSRTAGEKQARGAYILSLDGDDYLDLSTCKILYKTIYHIALHEPLQDIELIKNPFLQNTAVVGGGGKSTSICKTIQRSWVMQPKISLIIPTFNVESYIARCLESCINQTLHDIEILIIDDCGSDDSIQIAKDYASKDKRVKIIQNPKNLGAFASRIYGIKFAQGEYVAFLDADDYLNLNACEMMYQQVKYFAKNSQNTHKTCNTPDIVHFKAHYHVSHSNTSAPTLLSSLLHKIRYILPTRFSTKPLKNEQIAYNFFLKSSNFPKFTIWDKCYKASLVREAISYLESITYPLIMAEDMLKFFYIANLAKSYVSTPHRLYHYMLNTQSTTQNPRNKTKKIQDMRFIIEFLQCHCDVPNAPYAKQIAQKLSTNLASLIVLESRFDKLPKKQDSAGFVESTLSTFDAQDKKRDTQEFGVLDSCAKINNTNPNNANTDVLAGGGALYGDSIHSCLYLSLAPLTPLIEQGLLSSPKISHFARLSSVLGMHYLCACILSLQYWNRSLTFIRILAYIFTFGRLKI